MRVPRAAPWYLRDTDAAVLAALTPLAALRDALAAVPRSAYAEIRFRVSDPDKCTGRRPMDAACTTPLHASAAQSVADACLGIASCRRGA